MAPTFHIPYLHCDIRIPHIERGDQSQRISEHMATTLSLNAPYGGHAIELSTFRIVGREIIEGENIYSRAIVLLSEQMDKMDNIWSCFYDVMCNCLHLHAKTVGCMAPSPLT